MNTAQKPQLHKHSVVHSNFEGELQNDFGASDYDMMMIFGTDANSSIWILVI